MQFSQTESSVSIQPPDDEKVIPQNRLIPTQSNSSTIATGIIYNLAIKEDAEKIISKHPCIRSLEVPKNDLLRAFETGRKETGLGVVANKIILKDQILCEYVGEKIRQKTTNYKIIDFDISEELDIYEKKLTNNIKRKLTAEESIKIQNFYVDQQKIRGDFSFILEKSKNEIVTIDGHKKAGIASLVNCSPNGFANTKMVVQNNEILYQAIQDIQPGEEILIDYGETYFGSEHFRHIFPIALRSIDTFLEQNKQHYPFDPVPLSKEEQELLGTPATHVLMPDYYLRKDTFNNDTPTQINHLPFIEVVMKESGVVFQPLAQQQFITALMFASLKNDLKCMERIIKKGACVNFVTENGRSAWYILSASYDASADANRACLKIIKALKNFYAKRKWSNDAYKKYISDNLKKTTSEKDKSIISGAFFPKKIKIKPKQFKNNEMEKVIHLNINKENNIETSESSEFKKPYHEENRFPHNKNLEKEEVLLKLRSQCLDDSHKNLAPEEEKVIQFSLPPEPMAIMPIPFESTKFDVPDIKLMGPKENLFIKDRIETAKKNNKRKKTPKDNSFLVNKKLKSKITPQSILLEKKRLGNFDDDKNVGYAAFLTLFKDADYEQFMTFVKIFKPNNNKNTLKVCLSPTAGNSNWSAHQIKMKIQAIPLAKLEEWLLKWRSVAEHAPASGGAEVVLMKRRAKLADQGLDFIKKNREILKKIAVEKLEEEVGSTYRNFIKLIPTDNMDDYKILVKLSMYRRFKNPRKKGSKLKLRLIWLPDDYENFDHHKVKNALDSITRAEVDSLFFRPQDGKEKASKERETFRKQAGCTVNKPAIKEYLKTFNGWKDEDFNYKGWGVDHPVAPTKESNPLPEISLGKRNADISLLSTPSVQKPASKKRLDKNKRKKTNPPSEGFRISNKISMPNRLKASSKKFSCTFFQDSQSPYAMHVQPSPTPAVSMSSSPHFASAMPTEFGLPLPDHYMENLSYFFPPVLDQTSYSFSQWSNIAPYESLLPSLPLPTTLTSATPQPPIVSTVPMTSPTFFQPNIGVPNSQLATKEQLIAEPLSSLRGKMSEGVYDPKHKLTNPSLTSPRFFKVPRKNINNEKSVHSSSLHQPVVTQKNPVHAIKEQDKNTNHF